MKKININRNTVLLLILFVVGGLGIAVMTFLESDGTFFSTIKEEETNSNYKDLQNKVDAFKSNTNWTKEDYLALEKEIKTSCKIDLITKTTEGNLITTLNTEVSNKVYQKCENYLLSRSADSQSEMINWLNFINDKTTQHSKSNYYKGQIIKYNYYATTLPKSIKEFTSSFNNYSDDKYQQYLTLLKNMPGLDAKYKVNAKFKNVYAKLKNDLDNFNYEYYNQNNNEDYNNDKVYDY